MQKNDVFETEISGMTAEGQGVGRAPDGTAVFVPGAAVGDTLSVRAVKILKTYGFGRIEKILSPSSARIQPDCPVCSQCGGCVYRHIFYSEELRVKQSLVDDCLRRIGGLSLQTEEILCVRDENGVPVRNGYRNKALYPLARRDGRTVSGFYAVHSHRVVPTERCPLSPAVFDRAAAAVCRFLDSAGVSVYDETTGKGLVRHLYLRHAESTGAVLLTLVTNGDRLPQSDRFVRELREAVPELTGILLSVNRARTNVVLGKKFITLWGEPYLEDTLCGLRFRLAPNAFYQVNRRGAELLYAKAAEFAALRPDDLLLDLYCGAGTIGLSMAGRVRRLIGVEIVPEAVENARENAQRNEIGNAEFFCADAGEAARRLLRDGLRPTVAVVDPPRKGCGEDTLSALAAMSPERLVYVSCDPATLARDCARLRELGYSAIRAAAVDMFPCTGHVETVVLLSKGEIDSKKVRVEFSLEGMDMSGFQKGATYEQIKAYVLKHTGLKVSSLYISQVKRKCGLDVGQNYNLSKKENAKVPQCPPEKEAAIVEALKYFQMLE